MKRWLFSFAVVVLLLGALVPAAYAEDQWCTVDPLVQIVTPAGNRVHLHVTNYGLGLEHLQAVRAAQITYTVAPSGTDSTDVVIRVLIPDDGYASGFPTKSVVSTGPMASGTVLSTATGTSGTAMLLPFTLNVP